jgi:tetratricopeptide (TPR) repeat protein
MNQLKAFVGHSFTDNDETVVRAFLKFFDQVKNMNIGFSWEHAEPAEPKELAEKVLRLMEDKNLFIGICTSKEAAIQSDKLRKGTLKKKILKAEEIHFTLKTSDWIIQEIGLAKGRNMDLILLVEQGVRQPGGLQGSLEYITFERHSPEKSFVKVLEMVQSLLPKAKALMGKEAEASPSPEEKSEPEKQEISNWLQPRADWNRRQYEFALMHAVTSDDEESEKRINQAYLASKECSVHENCESWEAFGEYARIIFGKGGRLAKLEEIAKESSENAEVQRLLAKGYQEYKDYDKAAQCFEMAAQKSEDVTYALSRHSEAILALSKAGKKEEARAIREKMKALAPKVEGGEAIIISAFRQVAELSGDSDDLFGLTERLLHINPSDTDARFNLAYNYSQKDQEDASLYHYLKIPDQERGAMTWNNLGVEFDHFNLASKAVSAYRKSEELGETLAMSNLAYKLIKAGFLHEAEELSKRAMTIQGYHKNVSHAVAKIKDLPDEEKKKETEIAEKAVPLSEFYRDYGQALLLEDQSDYIGQWQGLDCVLNVSIENKKFIAEGDYEQQANVGLGSYYSLGMLGKTQTMKKYKVKYEGIVDGRTVKCIFTQNEEGAVKALPTLLGGADKGVEVLMILSDDLKEICVYEKRDSQQKNFYLLRRID